MSSSVEGGVQHSAADSSAAVRASKAARTGRGRRANCPGGVERAEEEATEWPAVGPAGERGSRRDRRRWTASSASVAPPPVFSVHLM